MRVVTGFRLDAMLKNGMTCHMKSLHDPDYVVIYFDKPAPPNGVSENRQMTKDINFMLGRLSEDCVPMYGLRVLADKEARTHMDEDEKHQCRGAKLIVVELPEKARITQETSDPALGYLGEVARRFFKDELRDLKAFEAFEITAPQGDINLSSLLASNSRAEGPVQS